MEFRVLEYFLAVAREQSITAAAASLHISQPALSTQLKALEKELGKQLLIRGVKGSRKVLLTEEGMISGNVYIGAGETESVRLFAEATEKVQKKYPDIRYHISSGNAEHVLEYLDKGLIDFGLLFTEIDAQWRRASDTPSALIRSSTRKGVLFASVRSLRSRNRRHILSGRSIRSSPRRQRLTWIASWKS